MRNKLSWKSETREKYIHAVCWHKEHTELIGYTLSTHINCRWLEKDHSWRWNFSYVIYPFLAFSISNWTLELKKRWTLLWIPRLKLNICHTLVLAAQWCDLLCSSCYSTGWSKLSRSLSTLTRLVAWLVPCLSAHIKYQATTLNINSLQVSKAVACKATQPCIWGLGLNLKQGCLCCEPDTNHCTARVCATPSLGWAQWIVWSSTTGNE